MNLCLLKTFVAIMLPLLVCLPSVTFAQEPSDSLHETEQRIAERYDRLEILAGRLAELSRSTQPRRSQLLRELISKSREKDISGRFAEAINLLEKNSLGKALNEQKELQGDLELLLQLLLQEDRDRQIESQRKRIGKYLEEVKKLIRQQRGIKARTEGGDLSKKTTKDQARTAKAAGELKGKIEETEDLKSAGDSDATNESDSESDSAQDSKKAEDPSGKDKKANDSAGKESQGDTTAKEPSGEKGEEKSTDPAGQSSQDPQDGKPSDESSQSQQKNSDSDNQNSPGKPSPGNPSNPSESGGKSQPQQPQSPMERALERLQQAQQRMQQAQEKLEEAQRENAIEKQEEALRELEQAKAELERILRQLREEELERMLVLLEARIRKMLEEQTFVYEETKRLSTNSQQLPEHEIEITSGRLRRREDSIAQEADRALLLLREDGTSVAFPEAIEQAREDMLTVATRLSEVKIGPITQGLEEDIIEALEEALAALQKALKELREQKSQPMPQQGQGQPGEQPLIDQLAELRMIRALQNRINRRTQRYGELLGDDFALEQDLRQVLSDLARRQERVFDATRDLESGRNR